VIKDSVKVMCQKEEGPLITKSVSDDTDCAPLKRRANSQEYKISGLERVILEKKSSGVAGTGGKVESNSSSSTSSSSSSSCGSIGDQDIEDLLEGKQSLKRRNKKKRKKDKGKRSASVGLKEERDMIGEQVKRLAEMQDNIMRMVQHTERMVNGNYHMGGVNGNVLPFHPAGGFGGYNPTWIKPEDTGNNQGWVNNVGHGIPGPNEQRIIKQEGEGSLVSAGHSGWPGMENHGGSGHNGPQAYMNKNKNEQRRQRYHAKKLAAELEEDRRRMQHEQQNLLANDLDKHLKKMQRGSGGGGVQNGVAKVKTEKYKVKKHSVDDETGEVKGLFQLGKNDAEWIGMDDIWNPANQEGYAAVWREYCERKDLPTDWGNPDGDKNEDPNEETAVRKNKDLAGSEEEEEEEEAVCIGHHVDKKGLVHMVLRWTDDPDDSLGKVAKIMGMPAERKAFGQTWFDYCDGKGIKDEVFRIKGIARVESVLSHEWDEDGRPVAEVQWKHGDVSKLLVATAMEKGSDNNKMKWEWGAYCLRIGATEEAFRHGHVNKEKRKKKSQNSNG
jgi:hypothetical protein